MNLHRVSGKADWANVAPTKRTIVQKLAASTGGVITPANIISSLGIGLVIYGLALLLDSQPWLGTGLVVVGRLLDIADGAVAEATHTKSPLGEIVDASFDKIGTLLTIIVLILADIAPTWVLLALILPQLLIPLTVFYKKRQGVNVHPTREGKFSMALAWVSVVGLLFVYALGDVPVFTALVYTMALSSLLLGLYALWQYSTGRG